MVAVLLFKNLGLFFAEGGECCVEASPVICQRGAMVVLVLLEFLAVLATGLVEGSICGIVVLAELAGVVDPFCLELLTNRRQLML